MRRETIDEFPCLASNDTSRLGSNVARLVAIAVTLARSIREFAIMLTRN